MIRRIFTIVLALAASVIAALWVYNARTGDVIEPYREYSDNGSWMFRLDDGQIRISHWLFRPGTSPTSSTEREKFGFGFYLNQAATPLGETLLTQRVWFPAWWALFILSAIPVLESALWVQRKLMRRPGHCCPACEYSLIGLASARCPECGAAVDLPDNVSEKDFVDPAYYRRVRKIVIFSVFGVLVGGSGIIVFLVTRPNAAPPPPQPAFTIQPVQINGQWYFVNPDGSRRAIRPDLAQNLGLSQLAPTEPKPPPSDGDD